MSCFARRISTVSFAILFLLLSRPISAQNTIYVPGDQATIQGAINVANTGDTVLVAPGTYSENISFLGKAITVTSSSGASVTIIDGGGKASVVTFNSGEGPSSVLNGFTIQNGNAGPTTPTSYGGGISISNYSYPTITSNVIQNNTACDWGGGIGATNSSPTRIQGNTILNNTQAGCFGGSGGGIAIMGAGAVSAQIIGNVIANNTWPSGNGGGISLGGAGTPIIKNNVITGNTATGVSPAAQGGGISMDNGTNAVIVQNLIYNNTAGQGSGIYFLVDDSSPGPILVNNTIIGGSGGSQGVAVYANGYVNQVQFFNNLLIGPSGQNAVYCDGTYQQESPTFTNNDVFSPSGTGLAGTCASQSGQSGNISADPQLVNAAAGDFHLQPTSPAVDAGSNSAPDLPQTDYAGNPRILDGNNDCVSTVDMGAYELVRSANVSFSTNTLTFASQPIGTSSNPQSVGLSNTGSTCFQFSSFGITGDFSQTNTCSAAGVRAGSSCAFNVTFTPTGTGTRSGVLAVSGSDGITPGNLTVNLSGIGAAATYSISGTISGPGGNGATVTLSGTASATVTASSTGTYTFSNLTNGSYAVTPSNSGFTFTPPNQGVTVSGANVAGVNFSSAALVVGLAIDKSVSTDRSTSSSTIVSPAFTTTAGDELLLAFISTDGKSGAMTVTSVAGAGLTWSLVKRANAQAGTAEIWRAFAAAPLSNVAITANLAQSVAASITVMTFTGVDTSGTNGSGAIGATAAASAASGAPSASLTTTRNNSWVFGVGNDWDNATARTPGSNQTLVHQYLATIGDTYWVQQQNSPTALSGTTVTINDTAPTTDRYNLAIVEVLPPTSTNGTYSISGTISGPGGNGATVTLTGTSDATTTASASGSYSFAGLANGAYTVAPSNAGFTFTPASQPVTINNANMTANFTTVTYSISGTISGPGGSGAIVTLSGTASASTGADASGNYSFGGLVNGSYTVTPSNSGFSFNPGSQNVTVSGASMPGINFTSATATTFSISGTISGSGGNGATVTLSGTATGTVTANVSGAYTFTGLNNGSYTVTSSKTGFIFTPASQAVTVAGASMTAVNFTSTAKLVIDKSVSTDRSSSAATIASPAFTTAAANELLLAFISTDGPTSGTNTTVSSIAGGGLTWALVRRTNTQSGTAEVWRAFAPVVLTNVTVTATLSLSKAASMTVVTLSGVDTTGTGGSGAIGATASGNASSGAPTATLTTTRNNSWVFGVGDDWDNSISRTLGTNQTMIHQYLATVGDTYWVQRQTAATPTSGTVVTINDTAPTGDRYNLTVVEVLPSL